MNWLEIDKIIWNMISAWNGSDTSKKDLLKAIAKKFNWTEKQTIIACQRHFNMYNKKNM